MTETLKAIGRTIQHVASEVLTIKARSTFSAQATCSEGYLLTGGGCILETGLTLRESYPMTSRTWFCAAENNTMHDSTMQAYAICISVNHEDQPS